MNKISIITIAVAVVTILAVAVCIYLSYYNTNNTNNLKGNAYISSYISMDKKDEEIILSSYEEFNNYFSKYDNNILKNYNEEYFTSNSLAVVYVSFHPDTPVQYKNAKIKDDMVIINYDFKSSKEPVLTEIITGGFVIVEIPKGVNKILDNMKYDSTQ